MGKFLYYAIFLIVVFIILFLLSKLRRKSTQELEKILYFQNNPKLYLQLLKNPMLKVLYRKSILLQFELDAYLLLGDDSRVEDTIGLLDGTPMTKGESLEFCQKKLSYFCTVGKRPEAESVLQRIKSILSKVKGDKAEFIRKESKMIFDIYIRRDTNLIEELERAQMNEQGTTRGLTLYRLAKLNFFNNNAQKARTYLNRAKELLANTAWADIVESALKDMSILNYK
jgi:hypothetical protein